MINITRQDGLKKKKLYSYTACICFKVVNYFFTLSLKGTLNSDGWEAQKGILGGGHPGTVLISCGWQTKWQQAMAQTHVFDTPDPVFSLRAGTWSAEALDVKKFSTLRIALFWNKLYSVVIKVCFFLCKKLGLLSLLRNVLNIRASLSLTQASCREWPVIHPPWSPVWTASAQSPVSIYPPCLHHHHHTHSHTNTHKHTDGCDSAKFSTHWGRE